MQKTERIQLENIVTWLMEVRMNLNNPRRDALLYIWGTQTNKNRYPDKKSDMDRIIESLLEITFDNTTGYGSYKAHRDGFGI